MTHKRLRRALSASALSLSLVSALLIAPLGVLGATPAGWHADDPVPLPASVSPGSNAGYELKIYNDGPSTVSQLYLFTEGAAPDPVFVQASQGSCNTSGPLFCTLGQFKPSPDPITVVVAFPTPADASGQFSVDFVFNTTGLGSGGGDASHGDAIQLTGTTGISADGTNFDGTFVVFDDERVVANAPISGAGNQQSTRLFSPATAIAVTVEDGPQVADACPAGFECVLESSEIHVGDGSDSYGLFKVVIQIDKTALRGLSLKNLEVLHVYDDGVTFDQIDEECPKRGTPTSECATISNLPGGHGEVTLWLERNGWVKFH